MGFPIFFSLSQDHIENRDNRKTGDRAETLSGKWPRLNSRFEHLLLAALLLRSSTHYSLFTTHCPSLLCPWRRGPATGTDGMFPFSPQVEEAPRYGIVLRFTGHRTRDTIKTNLQPATSSPSFRGPPSTHHSLFTTHCPSPLFHTPYQTS